MTVKERRDCTNTWTQESCSFSVPALNSRGFLETNVHICLCSSPFPPFCVSLGMVRGEKSLESTSPWAIGLRQFPCSQICLIYSLENKRKTKPGVQTTSETTAWWGGRARAEGQLWHAHGTVAHQPATFPCKDTEGIEIPGFPFILEGQMLHFPFCRPSIVCGQFLNRLWECHQSNLPASPLPSCLPSEMIFDSVMEWDKLQCAAPSFWQSC